MSARSDASSQPVGTRSTQWQRTVSRPVVAAFRSRLPSRCLAPHPVWPSRPSISTMTSHCSYSTSRRPAPPSIGTCRLPTGRPCARSTSRRYLTSAGLSAPAWTSVSASSNSAPKGTRLTASAARMLSGVEMSSLSALAVRSTSRSKSAPAARSRTVCSAVMRWGHSVGWTRPASRRLRWTVMPSTGSMRRCAGMTTSIGEGADLIRPQANPADPLRRADPGPALSRAATARICQSSRPGMVR